MFSLQSKAVLHAILAVLLGINCLHCWYGEARVIEWQALQKFYARNHQTLPVDPLRDACHNESGCICHGATLVDTFDASSALPAQDASFIPDYFVTATVPASLDGSSSLLCDNQPCSVAISGRVLRTQLVSFLN